jgi:PadR family transcriptional regulator PadR
VVEGTIYPLLTRLKNDGLFTVGKNPHQDPQKILWSYRDRLTFLNELNSTWTELSDAVNLTNQNNSQQDCKYKLRRNVLS